MKTRKANTRSAFHEILRGLESRGLLREEVILSSRGLGLGRGGGRGCGSSIVVQGKELIDLSSNDYLGLSRHPEIIEAACRAVRRWGSGCGASRLICGTTQLHAELEEKLCSFLGTAQCLIFGSGYLANAGILSGLTSGEDVVFSDRFNHASIVDGCRLSKAKTRIYDHLDTEHLAALMKEESILTGKKFIVTESTFSMDGDEAPLSELAGLSRSHGAFLVVDEAHSIGIKGKGGRGLVSTLPAEQKPDLIVGTFGKALGAYGAFAASTGEIREVLINQCRTLIYSTSVPPAVLGAVLKSIEIVSGDEGKSLRKKLRRNCRLVNEAVAQAGWKSVAETGPIILLPMKSAKHAVEAEQSLRKKGIFLRAIRYPTVPEGKERLRIVVNAALDENQIDKFLSALKSMDIRNES